VENFSQYFVLAAIAALFIWRWVKSVRVKKQLPALLSAGAIIVDVRSREEFAQGHANGSINVPLQSLEEHSKQFDKSKPIILCCASGARSGMAASILKKNGFAQTINGGSWSNLR